MTVVAFSIYSTLASTVIGILGAVLGYLGLFLYEDEERVLQSKLEDWWIQLHESSSTAFSAEAHLLARLATLISLMLDKALGKRLLSTRAIAISLLGSIAGLSIYQIMDGISYGRTDISAHAASGLVITVTVLLGFAAARWKFVPLAVCCVVFSVFVWWLKDLSPLVSITTSIAIQVVTISNDFAAIIIIRKLLRKLREAPTLMHISARLMALGLVLVLVFSTPVFLVLVLDAIWYTHAIGTFTWWLPGLWSMNGNIIAFLIGSLLLLTIMAIHHAFWPAILRSMYGLQRIGIFKYRKALMSAGVVLVIMAIAPSEIGPSQIWVAIKKIFLE